MEVAGPLGTPQGLAQRKRASPRGEAGTSDFLSVSDSDRRVPAELGQESQASSCVEEWNSTYALEKEMATHSSVLAWRIPGTGEPGGLPSMGSHRVGHN